MAKTSAAPRAFRHRPDLADEAGLTGQQRADAHAVLGRDDELDFIQACAALVGQLGRAPSGSLGVP
jgi:hypothetical protein